MPEVSAIWGIDLGGTKIEGLVIAESALRQAQLPNEQEPEVLARRRIHTEALMGYEHILFRVKALVESLEDETGRARPTVIGIGTPGSRVPSTGRMKNCNTTCLNGRELLADLQQTLGVQVCMANDANCFALAEARLGAGKGCETVFGVIMGTGVGGGIVIRGTCLEGPNGLAGEWGHMTLDKDGPPCYCGRRGCVETFLSGPAVEMHHFETFRETMSLTEIAASGKDSCDETIAWMCRHFGAALAQVVNLLDPDVIVLGGGAGQTPQLKTLGVMELRRHVFGPDFRTPLLSPELGDSAGVFGAALLALPRA